MKGGMPLPRGNDDLGTRFAFVPDKRCRVMTGQNYISVKRCFFQEGDAYNRFASYKEFDHDFSVAELPDHLREQWYRRYFIAEEKMPGVVMKTLGTILETNIGTIEQRNGYTFSFPNCHKDNMEYDKHSKVSLLLAGRNKRRSFQNQGQTNAATRTAWAIPKLREALRSGRDMSQRTLLYLNKRLYLDQVKSDGIVNDLCCMTGSRRSSLNVVPAERGLVLGNVVLRKKGGHNVSCSAGIQIPRKPELYEDIVVHEDAGEMEYILVVEKHTMMTYLEEMDYHNKHHCIILTGLGMPSISTRQFLKWLKDHTGLPVYGLCDPDPEGVEIMSVYARGSVNSAFDNLNISVPSIRWIGFSTSDLDDYGLKLPDFCFEILTDLDRTKLSSICSNKLSNEWQRRIRHMKQFGKKFAFEELGRFGASFFADVLLPQMVQNCSQNRIICKEAVVFPSAELCGIHVKPGCSVKFSLEYGFIWQLSQALLIKSKKDDTAIMFVKIGDKRRCIGTLSSDRFPQTDFDLIFERDFELSHTSESATVIFRGYNIFHPAKGDEMAFDSDGSGDKHDDSDAVDDDGADDDDDQFSKSEPVKKRAAGSAFKVASSSKKPKVAKTSDPKTGDKGALHVATVHLEKKAGPATSGPPPKFSLQVLQNHKQEVIIEKIVRRKRRCVTVVKGLELFGVNLRDASKKLGKKFATGALVVKCVTQCPTEKEQINVQGHLSYAIKEFIINTWPDIPESAIYFIEDGRKIAAA